MEDFNEYDCIILKTNLEGLPKGTTGCIVFDYKRSGMYEVEFFDDDHNTICVETVNKKDLIKADYSMPSTINLNLLEYSWSATVVLSGNQEIDIWWTCWPSIRKNIKEVKNVSSDLPKYEIKKSKFIIKHE